MSTERGQRRPRGTGGIRNRGSKRNPRWFARYYIKENGKRRQVAKGPFPTKTAAGEWLKDELERQRKGRAVLPSKVTVTELLGDWLDAAVSDLQPTTANGYRSIIDGRLVPHIGDIKVQDLTPGDIARCYKELRRPGANRRGQNRKAVLSETSIQRTHQVLYTALGWALSQDMIARNPADDVRKPKRADTEMQVWNSEQLAAFLSVATSAGDRLAAFWRLAAYTGMRRSELLGLLWIDVDLDVGRLSVRRKRTRVGYEMLDGAGGKTDTAKRTIDLDAGTVEILKAWRATQDADRRAWRGAGWTETGLVFTRQDGKGVHADHIADQWPRTIRRAQEAVHATLDLMVSAFGDGSGPARAQPALPRIRFHDLRHTHATLLLKAGVPVKVVSERLGHASTTFTMNTYQHVIPGMQAEAAAVFADAVGA